MDALMTPRARLIPTNHSAYLNGTGCIVTNPADLAQYFCVYTGTRVAAHLDEPHPQGGHGPMCPEHARQQLARCLAGTC